jgi:hypothetical protein
LTIPTAAVLFLPLLVQAVRQQTSWSRTLLMSASLAIGLALQFAVILSAPERRNVGGSMEALTAWVHNMPDAVLTYWPGMSFGETRAFGYGFPLPPFEPTGWLVILGILGLGLWAVIRTRAVGVGLLLLVGLGVGALPALTGEASNRYYVVPLLLWAAAGVIALDRAVPRHRAAIVSGVLVSLLVVWWPAYAVSAFRGQSTPNWQSEVTRIRAECTADPAAVVDVRFAPDWPWPWTAVFEPTTSIVTCAVVQ